jgi:hypothetical protein
VIYCAVGDEFFPYVEEFAMNDRLEGQSKETAVPGRRLSVAELDHVTGGKAGDEVRNEDGTVKMVLQ